MVDLTNFRRLSVIALDAAPSAVLPHPASQKAFVLAPRNGTVYELEAASLSVSRRVRAGNDAVSMKMAPTRDAVWVLYRDPAAIVEIPLDSLRPRRHIRLAAAPDDFDLSSTGRAAIASRQAHTITLASLDHAAVERTMAASVEPTSVCFQPNGEQMIAASGPDRSVTIIDVATGKVVVRLPLPFEPRNYCFNADGGQLFFTGDGMDAVAILYPYQTEIAETVLAGRAPAGMAVLNTYLFVTNPSTNRVTVLDIDTRKLVSVIEVGLEPRHIVFTPDNQYALVLNEKSGDLAVIRYYSVGNAPRDRHKSSSLFTMIPVGEKPVSAAVISL